MEPQCCHGDGSKHQAQFSSNGYKCPDCAWTKLTAAAQRRPVKTDRGLVFVLCVRVRIKHTFLGRWITKE